MVLERTGEPVVFDEEKCEALLKRETLDWLFIGLSTFTHIYLVVLAIVFFGRLANQFSRLFSLLDLLQNPYLGALGVYVVLKEIRKRRRAYPSRYWGELFVVLWVALLVIATFLTIISGSYNFDNIYRIILINGLLVLIIYIGGSINRP